jgi:hypothetical protein
VRVLEGAVLALDVGIDQPELFAVMGQARRPDAAAIGIAAHVELGFTVQRTGDELPVGEIPGVMDLDAGEPFKGRGGDIIIVADPQDGRVRIEARENGIGDLGHEFLLCDEIAVCALLVRKSDWAWP